MLKHSRGSSLIADQLSSLDDSCLLVGAAVSAFGSAHVPDARTAVCSTLRVMLARLLTLEPGYLRSEEIGELAEVLSTPSTLTAAPGRLVTPLEALLEAVGAEDGVAASVVEALCGAARPNPIHDLIAAFVSSGNNYVLTTNFDTCIEQAMADVSGSRWYPGAAPLDLSTDLLLKLHGSVDRPETLRHTLRSIRQGFDDRDRRLLRELTERPLVVAGYAGADYDIMDVISPHGDAVWWLQLEGQDTPIGAVGLAETRDVNVVFGNLRELSKLDPGAYRGNDPSDFESRLELVIESTVDRELLLQAVGTVLFDARVNDPRTAPWEHRYAEYRGSVDPVGEQTRRYLAGRDHDTINPLKKLRCAWKYIRLARSVDDDEAALGYFSEAGDALDGILLGQGPVIRRFTYPWHSSAAAGGPVPERGWYEFRAGRCAWARGDWDLVGQHVDRALNSAYLSTWQRAHCLRLRALWKALKGLDWHADIEEARSLFMFASQTLAAADLYKAEAVCYALAGDRTEVRSRLDEALKQHQEAGRWVGRIQGRLAIALHSVAPSAFVWLAKFL